MFTMLQRSSDPLPPDPLLASVMQCPLDFKEQCAFRQLLLSILENFPPINKLTDFNYTTWARDCAEGLDMVSCGQFIDGSAVKPTDPVDLYRWIEQDRYVAKQLILSHVSDSERGRVEQQCRGFTSSYDLWNGMRRFYLSSSTIADSKFKYLLRASGHVFPPGGPFAPTLEAIRTDIERLYSIGAPTADDMFYVVLFRALGDHHSNIQMSLPLPGTVDRFVICQLLAGIDLLHGSDSIASNSADATAAAAVPAQTIRAPCVHCNRSNHSSNKCWEKFGKPEWLQMKERDRKAARALGSRSSLSTPSI